MNITRDEIISRTQCCMEELPPVWEGSLTQNEGVTINRYIDAKIGETLRIIALTAPPHLLWSEAYPNLPEPENIKTVVDASHSTPRYCDPCRYSWRVGNAP